MNILGGVQRASRLAVRQARDGARLNALREQLRGKFAFMFDPGWAATQLSRTTGNVGDSTSLSLEEYLELAVTRPIDPCPWFSVIWYSYRYLPGRLPIAAVALDDYFSHHPGQERAPSAYFAPDWYLTHYGEARGRVGSGASVNALHDYVVVGGRAGHRCNPFVDEDWYLHAHPEVGDAVARGEFISGFHHYLVLGRQQGFSPDPRFSELRYLAAHPDVSAAVSSGAIGSGYDHYLQHGKAEGRSRGNDVVNGRELNIAF